MDGLLGATLKTFFPQKFGGNILSEVACEPIMTCDRNQLGFKGYLAMWLAFTAILVPKTAEQIIPRLQGTVVAVGKQCSGKSENLCGSRWYQPNWDGIEGLEVQMAALGAVTSNLMVMESQSPNTIDTNPDAKEHQIDSGDDEDPNKLDPINTGDRAGAWILTIIMVIAIGGAVGWLIKS